MSDLELLIENLTHRYEMDDDGRLVGDRDGGRVPRFLFGRTAEGCIWRFRFDLPKETLVAIAKLAARERGWGDGVEEGATPAPPERLVMMARLLGDTAQPAESTREPIVTNTALRGEIWVFE